MVFTVCAIITNITPKVAAQFRVKCNYSRRSWDLDQVVYLSTHRSLYCRLIGLIIETASYFRQLLKCLIICEVGKTVMKVKGKCFSRVPSKY